MTTFAGGSVVLDPVRVHELLKGQDGPVVRDLFVAGELLRQEAKRRCGVSSRNDIPGGRRRTSGGRFVSQRKPGTLRDSIVKRLIDKGGRPTMQVGSDDPVALWHHEGTQPHAIRAKNAPKLVFYWAKVGSVVAFTAVQHPGTKPNRFLTDSLSVLRGRY